MFNNINENNDYLYNSQLENQSNIIRLASLKANAYNKSAQVNNKNPYVDTSEISANAIALFEKDCDIEKFNKIALSDPEDFSHLDRMKELFSEGVVDVFEDNVLEQLVTNSKLWDDLEL